MFVLSFRLLGSLAGIVSLLGTVGCSGGSSGTAPVPNTQFCGNDTQYALARPLSGGSIPSGTSTVEIVASGDANQISASFANFDLLFVPTNSNGPTVTTGSLSKTSDSGGIHPFPTDFYYNGTINSPGLASGTIYNVFVNAFTSNCTPVGPIGQVGTP